MPSQVLGLHLERDGESLRLFDPATDQRLLSRREGWEAAKRRAEEAHRRAEAAEAEHRRLIAEAECRRLTEENERLRREIEAFRAGQSSALGTAIRTPADRISLKCPTCRTGRVCSR